MENPVKAVTSNLTVSNVIKVGVGIIAFAAILELIGWSSLMLQPIATLKAKFGKGA